jgi:hypothetical protein
MVPLVCEAKAEQVLYWNSVFISILLSCHKNHWKEAVWYELNRYKIRAGELDEDSNVLAAAAVLLEGWTTSVEGEEVRSGKRQFFSSAADTLKHAVCPSSAVRPTWQSGYRFCTLRIEFAGTSPSSGLSGVGIHRRCLHCYLAWCDAIFTHVCCCRGREDQLARQPRGISCDWKTYWGLRAVW